MPGERKWAEGKRQNFQVLAGRIRGRERVSPCFGGRKGDQSCKIPGIAVIGHFPRQEVRNTTKQRAALGC